MARKEYGTTLQLWPSGRSVTYAGTYDSGYRVRRGDRWRPAGKDLARDIRIEELAEVYSDRDILCADSSLVGDCLKLGAEGVGGDFSREWEYEQIANLTPDPSDWTIEQCREWLDDNTSPVLAPTEGIPSDDDEDAWRDAVRDNAEPAEIFEWYRVTGWLAEQLVQCGECVLSNAYGDWWGRCATGQSLLMDGVLQSVARQFVD